jgi:hypothetical protein
MASRGEVYEIEMLTTSTGAPGTTGIIEDMDRRFPPTASHLRSYVHAMVDGIFDRLYSPANAADVPFVCPRCVRMVIEIERKEVKRYGKKS